jgi:hypothetical protein
MTMQIRAGSLHNEEAPSMRSHDAKAGRTPERSPRDRGRIYPDRLAG